MFRYGFKKRLQELGVDYGSSVLAAVSGGVDSMCMLDALVHSQLDLTIAVAHVNFNLRGQESDADTRMVTDWCSEHNITLHTTSFNTKEYAAQNGISVEMAARDLRYNWFYELMQQHGYNFLAIAHNANDNAETLLLNLTRGCGIEGITGIREKVQLEFAAEEEAGAAGAEAAAGAPEAEEAAGAAGADATASASSRQFIIRPLLSYSRGQIEKYALKFKVPFRTDSTNLLSDFSRNRIRNEVFPQLARINPSVTATFNRNIRHFQQASNVLQQHITEKCNELCHTFELFQELVESKFSHSFCGLNLRLNCIDAENGKYSMIICIVELPLLMAQTEWEFWVYQIAYPLGFSPAIIENICNSLKEEEGPKKFLSGSGEIIAVKERGLFKFYLNVVFTFFNSSS